MKELFVSYNVASLAKQKGFDEPCFGYFIMSGDGAKENFKMDYAPTNHVIGCISAPLYQQIIDWFREKHAIRIVDDIQSGTMSGRLLSSYKFNVIKIDGLYTEDVLKYSKIENKSFPSYYEALDKTLETILLRIKK